MDEKFKYFFEMVEKMREAQKGYFKAEYGSLSKQDFLGKSKALEREVDNYIKGVRNPNLFS